MTTIRELDALADQCRECADGDDASIDDHLDNCNVCKEFSEKAESFNMTLEVVQIMASRPEGERHQFLSTRLERYFSIKGEQQRLEALRSLMDAMNELSAEDRTKIIRTRLQILTSLPTEKRKILLGSLQSIYSEWDLEKMMEERTAIHAITQNYPIIKRIVVRSMFKKIMD